MKRNPAYMEVSIIPPSDPAVPPASATRSTAPIVGLVENLMANRNPSVSPETRYLQASFAVELVHKMLEFAWTAPAPMRAGIVRELKRTLALYSAMVDAGGDPLTG